MWFRGPAVAGFDRACCTESPVFSILSCLPPRNIARARAHTWTRTCTHQVALPELDGAIEPIVFAGRDSATGKSHSLPDRISSLVTRAINWARLRKLKNKEKKLAITVFSFPPDKGNVGTAAYLNVFGSIYQVCNGRETHGGTRCGLSTG